MSKTFSLSLIVVVILLLAVGCVQPSGFGPATPPATATAVAPPSVEATAAPAETLAPKATPTEVAPQATGTLQGQVTVGPLRGGPVQEGDVSATVPPEVYSERPVLVYAEDGVTLLQSVALDPAGRYRVALPAGRYVVSITLPGRDRSGNVPASVDILPDQITTLDISVDTGLR